MHKLLFDNNISHRVIARVSDIFPNANHVMLESLDESTFNDLAIYHGSPPKVIWIKIGNCKVSQIAKILIDNSNVIKSFLDNSNSTILQI